MAAELFSDYTKTHAFTLDSYLRAQTECVWKMEGVAPFDEAIISWNGFRPEQGKWTVWVSLFQEEWSPWMKYAEWAPGTQKTFKSSGGFAESYQDAASPKQGTCTGIQVKILAEEGADLTQLDSLYACLSHLACHVPASSEPLQPIFIPGVPLQSQMVLDHPRHKDLCSPTSTSTTVNTLLGKLSIDPVSFAKRSHDDEFDIYGNWILNTAEAYQQLGGAYRVHVQRLSSFADLHARLLKGTPVVVSVRGTIPGAPQTYKSGHLICVRGYDPKENRVHCIDSAFLDNDSTAVSYDLGDFLAAWALRKNIAYLFEKK